MIRSISSCFANDTLGSTSRVESSGIPAQRIAIDCGDTCGERMVYYADGTNARCGRNSKGIAALIMI